MPIERIHGPNVNEQEQKGVTSFYDGKAHAIFSEVKKRETSRTEWHDSMIDLSNALIQRELRRLAISDVQGLPSSRFVFLSAEDYHQELPTEHYQTRAFYSVDANMALLNVDTPREILFSQQMHENIHAHSFRSFMAFPEESLVHLRRLGVAMNPPTQHARFNGINEAVTERLRWKLCGKKRNQIQNIMGFTDEEMKDITHARSYSKYIELLDFINDRIAEQLGVTRDQCWDLWTRAMITGEMMGIRQVERVWGDGALRILSRLGYDKQIDAKVFKFFHTQSTQAAEKIRHELLDF